jgi:ribonuclease P protein component
MALKRLLHRREFLAAADKGRRFRTKAMTVQVRDTAAGDGVRVGLTASRHVGGATKRNRIRRRLRAAAGIVFSDMVGLDADIVLVARAEAIGEPFARLVADLKDAPAKARPHQVRPRQSRPNSTPSR